LDSVGALLDSAVFDPFKAYNFAVVIDHMLVAGFTSVEGIGWKTDVHTFKEGGRNDRLHKLPEHSTCGDLVLSKGLTLADPMWEWYKSTLTGKVKRRSGAIILLSDYKLPSLKLPLGFSFNPSLPGTSWTFHNAWPIALEGARLDASQTLVATQRLTLAVERIEKTVDSGTFGGLLKAAKSLF
jgi:phage tail-like protein